MSKIRELSTQALSLLHYSQQYPSLSALMLKLMINSAARQAKEIWIWTCMDEFTVDIKIADDGIFNEHEIYATELSKICKQVKESSKSLTQLNWYATQFHENGTPDHIPMTSSSLKILPSFLMAASSGKCIELFDIYHNIPIRKRIMLARKLHEMADMVKMVKFFAAIKYDIMIKWKDVKKDCWILENPKCESMLSTCHYLHKELYKEMTEFEYQTIGLSIVGHIALCLTDPSRLVQYFYINEEVWYSEMAMKSLQKFLNQIKPFVKCNIIPNHQQSQRKYHFLLTIKIHNPSINSIQNLHLKELTEQYFIEFGIEPTSQDSKTEINPVYCEPLEDTEKEASRLIRVKSKPCPSDNSAAGPLANSRQSVGLPHAISTPVINKPKVRLSASTKTQTTRMGEIAFRLEDLHPTTCHIIGQWDEKYIVTIIRSEEEKFMVLFDQHAVHERVRLENLISKAKKGMEIKRLKLSLELDASLLPTQMKNLEPLFAKLGFLLKFEEIASVTRVALLSVPTFIHDDSPSTLQDLCRSLAQDFENEAYYDGLPLSLLEILKSLACHGAIKFGEKLAPAQCQALILEELSKTEFPFICAHGRPSLFPLLTL